MSDMWRTLSRYAAVVVVGLAALSASGCGSPAPALEVAPSLDLSQFQGKWYEIARLPRATQDDCNGTTAFYTQTSDGSLSLVNQCNLGSATGPLYTVAMSASVPNAAVPAKLALTVGGYTGDYWILEIGANYEYAVVGHPSRLYWWLLSRTPSLDPTTMQGVLDRAKTSDFDLSQLLYTPQPPASERDALATPEGPIPANLSTGCSSAPDHGGVAANASWLLLVLAAIGVRSRSRSRQNAQAMRGAGLT
jgi:apolipoprotein D and lipocalin family protein